MHLLTSILLLSTSLLILAKPLPMSFNEVERRWASGHSEQQIHSGLSHRDMTPAWPIARSNEGDFAAATDERTMVARKFGAEKRGFWDFFAGKLGSHWKREASVEVPVLRPRKEMRYYFTS